MSKEAELRAMREARYSRSTGATTAPGRLRLVTANEAVAAVEAPTGSSAADAEALCGHRSMNGRTCTREQGHAAKSHRYS